MMSNRRYDNFADLLLGGGTHTLYGLSTGTIRATLIDIAVDDPNTATDVDYADLSTTAKLSQATLTNKTVGSVAAGVFDCDPFTFSGVSGSQASEVTIHAYSGSDATSPFYWLYDTASNGLPVTPNGNDIDVTPHATGMLII